jgi:Electron transfer DM13
VKTPLPVRFGIVLGVLVALLGGLWIAAGLIAPTYLTSIIFGVAWFVIASFALGKAVKRRPDLKWWVRGTFLVTAVACGAAFAWTSLRDEKVNEKVVTGVPAAALDPAAPGAPGAPGAPAKKKHAKPEVSKVNIAVARGEFEVADEGSAKGAATLIRTASGERVLTLTDFEVANGPDLRVYLVPGDGKDTGDKIDLGALKGNIGNQQYDVPGDAATPAKYRTVVIWCRSFSVAFARATLALE